MASAFSLTVSLRLLPPPMAPPLLLVVHSLLVVTLNVQVPSESLFGALRARLRFLEAERFDSVICLFP